MRKDLLLKLADLLEQDANNPTGISFNLRSWGRPESLDDSTFDDKVKTQTVPVSCGTSACAFGLAAISGIFKDEGLSYRMYLGLDQNLVPTFKNHGVTLEGFEAATAFFELPEESIITYILFDPIYYPTNKRTGKDAELEVARRIRKLVADGTIHIVGDFVS
jgi:hypothetical protein